MEHIRFKAARGASGTLLYGLILIAGVMPSPPAHALNSGSGTDYTVVTTSFEAPSRASVISQSAFADVAAEYELDPTLLYSIALAESARGRGDGNIAPWPWTLRVLSEPGIYAKNASEAKQELSRLLKSHKSIDIGMMQINLRYHGHRVKAPEDLLDPQIALNVGAQILRETLDSAEGDLELGIGRYHSWEEDRARNYGARILAFYRNIKSNF